MPTPTTAIMRDGEEAVFFELFSAVRSEAGTFAPFTDATLAVGSSPVRASHIGELRLRVDAVRADVGLKPYAWTDPTLKVGTTVARAQHMIDLRTALTEARAMAGLPTAFAEPIAAGTTIKAAHITELRDTLAATSAGPAARYSNATPDATMNAATIQMGGSVTAPQVFVEGLD